MRRHGAWVTTATRTVIDLARSLPFAEGTVIANGTVIADSALRLGKTTDLGWQTAARARPLAESTRPGTWSGSATRTQNPPGESRARYLRPGRPATPRLQVTIAIPAAS
jgi:hypothetical protein